MATVRYWVVVVPAMIGIGFSEEAKRELIAREARSRGVDTIYILAPAAFTTRLDDLSADGLKIDYVEWLDTYRYKTMYRLFQAINRNSMIVINECLRSSDRSLLRFNCIRHYTLQTDHVLVFQRLPFIDTIDDFAVLFDFVTKSRWKRTPVQDLPLGEAEILVHARYYAIRPLSVMADAATKDKYAKTKRELIAGIGLRDPHTIPRNLHMIGGKARASAMRPGRCYVARNKRLGLEKCSNYAADRFDPQTDVLDFPHRFIDFADFLAHSGQHEVEAIVSDLKVDQWYLERFTAWTKRLNDAQAALHR